MMARRTVNRTISRLLVSASVLAATVLGQVAALAPAAHAQEAKSSKFRDFADVTKDAEKIEGMFDLYREGQHLYAALTSSDLDRPILAPSIAKGSTCTRRSPPATSTARSWRRCRSPAAPARPAWG
jgi:hypothetical protein